MSLSRKGNAVFWKKGRETLRVVPWGRDGVRVQATVAGEFKELPGALLDKPLSKSSPGIERDGASATLSNGKIAVKIEDSGRLSFFRVGEEAPFLKEHSLCPELIFGNHGRDFVSREGGLCRISATFHANENERFYGLGQHRFSGLNQKGCVIELSQRNSEVAIPFLYSSLGYGFLWNHPGIGRVELSRRRTRWVADAARQIDFYVCAGDTPEDIMNRYAGVTGFPTELPEWASGFWQCKLRYKTQEEVLAIAREHKKRKLPISVIVIDFFHWTQMGDFKFDSQAFPSPGKMVEELEAMGIKLMVSIWPSIDFRSENYEEMRDKGFLVGTAKGLGITMRMGAEASPVSVMGSFYDATNPEAREYLWNKVKRNYYRHGVKVWWLDACEPEIRPFQPENLRYSLGQGDEVGCLYPLLHAQGFYEGMLAEGETEIISLCRSAWAGSQRYGAAVWSGDIPSTFESFREQIPAGLNIAMSGIPWWTTDIGGFMHGDVEDPVFRELIVRWFQYGVFCPLFRLHGSRDPRKGRDEKFGPNEVWSFGKRAYGIISELMFLRERLRPYIMRQMKRASKTGAPPMRPLFFDFSEDKESWNVEDQFMFGPDILVAPVAHRGMRKRRVYLPAGTRWIDVRDGSVCSGGKDLSASAPLESIPVYVREGASVLKAFQ